MAQHNSASQLSAQEIPNILKVARQKTALGLYKESIKSYNHALHVLDTHLKSISDPFLKDQWKHVDQEIKDEVKVIYKLYKTLKVFKGENPQREVHKNDQLVNKPAKSNEERPIKGPPIIPPSVIEHFGGLPFVKQEPRKDAKNINPPTFNEPKKDPVVWDPPSPKNQAKKPVKKPPKWNQGNPGKPPAKPKNKPPAGYLAL